MLAVSEVYPDSASTSDRVTYSYNRQGQRTRMTDQNGSVHDYLYDLLGRQTGDQVSSLAAGVDGAVRRIGQAYEVRGMVEKVTSYADAAGTTPVNEVQNAFNSFGQLKDQYQEHSGAVNTSTTPKVQYAYADGGENTIRPVSMTNPSGRVLEYRYDDAAAEKLSRVRTLRWDGEDAVRYNYLGVGTFVATDYLEPQVKLDYATGAGANRYAGWDRFGRIVDLLWQGYGAESSSSSEEPPGLVHLQYGYDRASNRTHRADLVAQFYEKDFDELYEYDGLHRLKKFHRGRLTDGGAVIESPTLQQGWRLDATGNWQNFTQAAASDPGQTLDQQRVANRVNEITQIARTVGPNWATPQYDRNGNMTVIPQPKAMTETYQATWDAWNRLVKLEEPDGGDGWQTLAEYQYDGQTWRTLAKNYAAGALDETRHTYFSSQWQALEERLGATPSSAPTERQFVWGLRYIDDLALRDRDSDASGTLDERLYAMQDANWNVVAVGDDGGEVQFRFAYDAYGTYSIVNPAYHDSLNDITHWETLYSGYRLDQMTQLFLVRYRHLHSRNLYWCSRDILVYPSKSRVSSYEYGDSNPLVGTDPKGLLKVTKIGDESSCAKGGLSGQKLDFELANKASGDGYFVQEIVRYESVVPCGGCPACPAKPPAKATAKFYEVWHVTAGNTKEDDVVNGVHPVTDYHYVKTTLGNCGWYQIQAEVRFYLETTTGDLSKDPGWGKLPALAGDLTATLTAPKWWGAKSVESAKYLTVVWWCCCGKGCAAGMDSVRFVFK